MDLPTLIEACFNGLAKGGAGALGSGLWALTQRLIFGLSSRFVSADDVSEADVLIELSDPNQMIKKMDEFRRDPELDRLINAWERMATVFANNELDIDVNSTNSNIVIGNSGSSINISQKVVR